MPLYTGSYALLIAESAYLGAANKGWSPLPNTLADVDKLAEVLRKHGFHVWVVSNATGAEIGSYLREFSAEYGTVPDNRLLYFFTGHGYSNPVNDFGYLVPIDAVDPAVDPKAFLRSAVPIREFQTIAHEVASRHAMFIFDSCFSGTIFQSKGSLALPDEDEKSRWRFLSTEAKAPARQFISAGSATEKVPAKSVFLPLLIDALNGAATSARDGFVTGKEIGLWLAQNVPTLNKNQNPQTGMILDPELARGDVTFQFSQTALPSTAESAKRAEKSKFVKKLSYSVDVYFDYDKSILKPASMAIIDSLVQELAQENLDTMLIVGHVDKEEQLSPAYGQKVAMRRADSVKNYLMSRGVPAAQVYTEGKFITEAKTRADLARSRRVTIAVSSTLK
ncbi:Outer membrane protein OmpA [Polaromonas sp. YR568]|nr:Outer membrane protein OmpA [Polaromonas sp. YR568]